MGNQNSNVSLKILVKDSVPKNKKGYIIAVTQPWRFHDYKIIEVRENEPFDNYIVSSPTTEYALVDTWDEFSESRLARFRCRYPCLIIFKNIEEYKTAMNHVKPTKKYEWKRFSEYVEPHIELNSAGDARYSPLFMKINNVSIEEYYQLYCKGWKYAGIDNWKDAKSLEPLQFIPVTHRWTREEVERDKDFLYIFTDNLMRRSGNNRIERGWYLQQFGSTDLFYPNTTQAVIRGLDNAFPISTMKDCYKTQLENINVCDKVWDSEIDLIQKALQSRRFKGIKFSAQHPFGQGVYSNFSEELSTLINLKLKKIGIDNLNCRPLVKNFEEMVKNGYRNYFFKNPSMFYELAVLGKTHVFTERFATTNNTQVRYYCELLNEYYNL